MSGPVARVDLAALHHNLARVRQAAPGRRVMAVVKANGYGHGAIEVTRALADADAFAAAVGTMAYELFCRLTRRVHFRYEGAGMKRAG